MVGLPRLIDIWVKLGPKVFWQIFRTQTTTRPNRPYRKKIFFKIKPNLKI